MSEKQSWPFVETPGEFTERLRSALSAFGGDMLAAVRSVLIENPATHSPIDMILFCTECGMQHIDKPEPHQKACLSVAGGPSDDACICTNRWDNPPHRTHLCLGCGSLWRPADVPTNGVKAITTASIYLSDELIDAHLGLAYTSSGLNGMTGESWDRVVARRFYSLGALVGDGLVHPPADALVTPPVAAVSGDMLGEPCPRGKQRPEKDCTNRHQCWEPCGELGHSMEHAIAGRSAGDMRNSSAEGEHERFEAYTRRQWPGLDYTKYLSGYFSDKTAPLYSLWQAASFTPIPASPGAQQQRGGGTYWLYELNKGEGVFQAMCGSHAERILRQIASEFPESGEPFSISAAAPSPQAADQTDAALKLTDTQILELAAQWGSFEESRLGVENNPVPQYHSSEIAIIKLVRAAIDAALSGQASQPKEPT